MSKCMSPPLPSSCASRASGAYLLSTPVVRSSKREPIATIRSASWMAKLAYAAPCMPSMCIERGSCSEKMPIAWHVVVTGTLLASARARSSAGHSEAPCPMYRIGFFAIASSSAQRSSAPTLTDGIGGDMGSGRDAPWSGVVMTSFGRSRWTGPGLPVAAMRYASCTTERTWAVVPGVVLGGIVGWFSRAVYFVFMF